MPRTNTASAQILLFPQVSSRGDLVDDQGEGSLPVGGPSSACGRSVVLCGTYRKDPEGLHRTFEQLRAFGFSILSPANVSIENEEAGFVYMRHESARTPAELENRHLDAIQHADFVWFFTPNGYVGPTGALEVGFAHANGIPVFSDATPNDPVIKQFVKVVDSPLTVRDQFANHRVLPPSPAVRSFQIYYRRVASQRGYSKENAKDCLMLMVEEVGELARALRKRAKLARQGKGIENQEALELADVFIYVVHMANILKIDLSRVVREKELLNIQKLLNAQRGHPLL
jgi:NTP pyrophosphatase (non-canonical NTP hydrolase)/nucleoside 2-deoxyribosyltransferase